ncbi:MAG: ATP-binding protein [Pseudomonadota bacterium]
MNLRVLLVGVVTLLLLAVVVVTAIQLGQRDREALVERFASDHRDALAEAANEIRGSLQDVDDDLRFVARLLGDTRGADDRSRALTTFLASVRAYRAAGVFDADGTVRLIASDPRHPADVDRELLRSMARTAREALTRRPEGFQISMPLATGDSWYRVFAAPITRNSDGTLEEAVALLIDTRPLLERVRLVAADPQTLLLVTGPHGVPAPVSSSALIGALPHLDSLQGLASAMGALAEEHSGSLRLSADEAVHLGLERGEAIAVYHSLQTVGDTRWSLLTVSSMGVLQAHEGAQARRLALLAAAIALVLLGFGGYLITTLRRQATLQERLRHASEVAHLHELSEKILNSIPAAIAVLAEDGHVTSMNQALRRRLPLDADMRSLHTALARAPQATTRHLQTLVERALLSGTTSSLLGEPLALFGSEGQFSVHAVPLERHAPDSRLLLVIDDVTEVHTLESQLLRAEKLATVGVLAAGIAHEIGSPLGVVRGRAEYIAGKLGEDHPQVSGLRIIIEQIDRVSRIIRTLLDFARIRPPAVAPVDLGGVLRRVEELLQVERERRGVVLQLAADAGLPALLADADQLEQVLLNLLLNALDACEPGGQVTLQVAPGVTQDVGFGPHLRIEVRDDGRGIPAEHLHRVFDPFFTTKKRGQGTGLGLAMVSQIVRNHGAQIELDSSPGQGTRVLLRWPLATHTVEESDAS